MADRLSGGRLADLLVMYRRDGASWLDIARRLHADFGIVAHVTTIANWHEELTAGDVEVTS